jgi:hypothetical protein
MMHHHHHHDLDGSQIANTAIGAYAGVRAAQGNWGPLVVVLLFSGGFSALFSGLMWLAVIAVLIGVAVTAVWLTYRLFVGLFVGLLRLANALRGIPAAWIFIPFLLSLWFFTAAYYYSLAVGPLPVPSPLAARIGPSGAISCETQVKEQQDQIVELGKRLNLALANTAQARTTTPSQLSWHEPPAVIGCEAQLNEQQGQIVELGKRLLAVLDQGTVGAD